MELTDREKGLLAEICNNHISKAAFSGMVFNNYIQFKLNNMNIDKGLLIKDALSIKVVMEDLNNGKETK